ncbi:MAG: DUF3817 domain-containing protein [Verrucomicrobiota bacterium]
MSFLDGVSYLVLLGIAMPLKYLADKPMAVTYVGWIHGGIFILLMLAIFLAWLIRGPSKKWFLYGVMVFFAALIPLAPFFIDRILAREETGS